MQVLEDRELSILFDYLTQHNQVQSIESIYADTYHEPKPAPQGAKPAPAAQAGAPAAQNRPGHGGAPRPSGQQGQQRAQAPPFRQGQPAQQRPQASSPPGSRISAVPAPGCLKRRSWIPGRAAA